ncbi:MAG TPA: HD domain-containing phosphohydrolase [Gemmatimonadaceae bacterium]|nr:HD domain-containing phosphohydrolase [Gemmatimonadaceae bacterium]
MLEGAGVEQGKIDIARAAEQLSSDLSRAESDYLRFRSLAEEEHRLRVDLESRLAASLQENVRLDTEAREIQAALEEERTKAQKFRTRSDQLIGAVKRMHRSLFSARDLSSILLNASVNLTGARRGLYVAIPKDGKPLKVKAGVNVPGWSETPSAFVRAIVDKVVRENDTFVCNSGEPVDGAAATRPEEKWRNYVATPVTIHDRMEGIIIAADKTQGDFNEEEVETLLSIGDHGAVALENRTLERELQSAYLSTVSVLADAVQAKDPYTHGHCELVSRLARLTASRLELPDGDRDVVCFAALLHDVGKIGVSDGVLNKPGPLLPEERDLVRTHVRVGHDLLARVPVLSDVAEVVLHHHEWFDGRGYPDGLSGEHIPVAARIVAVADAYCAMITRRSYSDALPEAEAIAELRRCAGTQFDPNVVEAFALVASSLTQDRPGGDGVSECGLLPGLRRRDHS